MKRSSSHEAPGAKRPRTTSRDEELARLRAENERLRTQNESLRAQNSARSPLETLPPCARGALLQYMSDGDRARVLQHLSGVGTSEIANAIHARESYTPFA